MTYQEKTIYLLPMCHKERHDMF